jgi:lysophospholipase L1-like esterase
MQIRDLLKGVLPGVFCLMHATSPDADHDGDINIDGVVDVVDLLWGHQALYGMRSLTPEQQTYGDVAPLVSAVPHPDGVFNPGDVLVIQRMVLFGLDFSVAGNQFNIGDSIGEAEAADGTIGEPHRETVWSTGYDGGDSVNSFNERFEAVDAVGYYENIASRDPVFNHAVSGAEMADFASQAQSVVTASAQTPTGTAAMVTVFLGNNDVCAESMATMTDPGLFEEQYRAGLDVLASSSATRNAQIHVSGIPAIYWLWNAKHDVFWCRVFVWPFVPCENLLDGPSDDCESTLSREDPDNNEYPGDGMNCKRRKDLHAIIRTYNLTLRNVLEEYRESGQLPNARFTDIYDARFDSAHVNGGDCFHPSTAGHALLAETEWCRTHWGYSDPACSN